MFSVEDALIMRITVVLCMVCNLSTLIIGQGFFSKERKFTCTVEDENLEKLSQRFISKDLSHVNIPLHHKEKESGEALAKIYSYHVCISASSCLHLMLGKRVSGPSVWRSKKKAGAWSNARQSRKKLLVWCSAKKAEASGLVFGH